ncbi:MAG: hypothetical protein METHP_00255 [Methanoregula sp. SKADARSKE-2]|nr:MAG: hypothetical protein METHP_00255 [Methanoregula sp. SKADARSKE-2]
MVTFDIDENSQMLNPKEGPEFRGIRPRTVHFWLRTGKMEGIKIPCRTWRIPRTSHPSFIERNKNIQPDTTAQKHTKQPIVSDSKRDTIPEGDGEQNISPQTRMKPYIRDRMG